MGEYKGHSDKAPGSPELDQSGSTGKQANTGSQQSARGQDIDKQDIDKQSIGPQSGRKQEGMQERKQQQDIGNQQGADTQRQNQQQGGQQAASGTPSLDDRNDDRNSRTQGSPGSVKSQP